MINTTLFGAAPDGAPVTVYDLVCAGAHVRVMDYGATILGIEVPDALGNVADIVLGFDHLDGYFDNPACYGGTIGPSANRTDNGQVEIGGTVYQMTRNDGPKKTNNLHTDLEHGLHKRVWDANVDEITNTVSFTCKLRDGELGLPGNRCFTVTYSLQAGPTGAAELTCTQHCVTDADTFVNMTNHSYFNLAGHDSGTILDQVAMIDAEAFLPQREDNVSSGEVRPVAGTPFDFRVPKELGRDIDANDEQLKIARGFDHCFCLDGFAPDAGPRHALCLQDLSSGRTLDIFVTAPGAHLYTGNWLDDTNAKNGADYKPRDGGAFEPEFWPDNNHHADWTHPVCSPDRPFSSTIVYRFSTVR